MRIEMRTQCITLTHGVLRRVLQQCKHLLCQTPESGQSKSNVIFRGAGSRSFHMKPKLQSHTHRQANGLNFSPNLLSSTSSNLTDAARVLGKQKDRTSCIANFIPAKHFCTDKAAATPETGCSTMKGVCSGWSKMLETSGIPEARASVEYIVAHVLGRKTLHGIADGHELNEQEVKLVDRLCQRRMQHEPVQYILGEWDFEDIELTLRPPVFIPRPETEELVGLAAEMIQQKSRGSGHLLEFCCGSGAISLALLNKFPELSGVAVDASRAACLLTQENSRQLGLTHRITVIKGGVADLAVLERLKDMGPFDIVVSNPPYIPSSQLSTLEPQILQYEDIRALDGGEDGLDIVRDILHICPLLLKSDSDILMEIQPGQPAKIQSILADTDQSPLQFVSSYQDFLQRERFCHLCRS